MARPDQVADYEARKVAGRCVQIGCNALAGDQNVRCDHHAELNRKSRRRSQSRRRERLGFGRCFKCGKQSSTYLCPACSVLRGRLPTLGASNQASNQRPKIWRADPGTNYVRYRGRAKRGKPPAVLSDLQDIDEALKELNLVRSSMVLAHNDAGLSKRERHDLIEASMHRIDRAERWLDELRGRYGKYDIDKEP